MKKIILGLVLLVGLMMIGCTDVEDSWQPDDWEDQQEVYEEETYEPPQTSTNAASLEAMCIGYYGEGGLRDACFAMSAIDHGVPELCELMTTETQERIILCMGEASQDPSYCAMLTSGSYEHYSCYSKMAKFKNDPSYCDEIDEEEAPGWKGACLVPFN